MILWERFSNQASWKLYNGPHHEWSEPFILIFFCACLFALAGILIIYLLLAIQYSISYVKETKYIRNVQWFTQKNIVKIKLLYLSDYQQRKSSMGEPVHLLIANFTIITKASKCSRFALFESRFFNEELSIHPFW